VFVYQHTAQPSLKRAVSVKGGDGGYEKRERQAGSGTQPSETELWGAQETSLWRSERGGRHETTATAGTHTHSRDN